ncbi:hypothetical protein Tco_0931535 [Tanacetum coccineum]
MVEPPFGQNRARSSSIHDLATVYESYDNLFTLRIIHGGDFTSPSERIYRFPTTNYFDLVDRDQFLLDVYNALLSDLGFKDGRILYSRFRIPGKSMDEIVESHKLDEGFSQGEVLVSQDKGFSQEEWKMLMLGLCDGVIGKKQGYNYEDSRARRRKILGLDRASIKGPYTGKILTMFGVDSNNGVYPLAYAIVEAEYKSSWLWRWELTSMPCKHVVATINNMTSHGKEVGIPEYWVAQCYYLNTWKEMYQYKVVPVTGSTFCLKCRILACYCLLTTRFLVTDIH